MSSQIRYNPLELSPMPPPLRSLEARIEKIKQQITALGDLRPGNLTQQYNVCGKPDCRCKATPPRKHGPYYQVSFSWKGNSKSQFVRRQDLAVVKKQLRNYRRLRQLLDRWLVLAMELSRRRLEPRKRGLASTKTRRRPRVSSKT